MPVRTYNVAVVPPACCPQGAVPAATVSTVAPVRSAGAVRRSRTAPRSGSTSALSALRPSAAPSSATAQGPAAAPEPDQPSVPCSKPASRPPRRMSSR